MSTDDESGAMLKAAAEYPRWTEDYEQVLQSRGRQLMEATQDHRVVAIVQQQAIADRLIELGVAATAEPYNHFMHLHDASVVFAVDDLEASREWGREVASDLAQVAGERRVLAVPGGLSDLLEEGPDGIRELRILARRTPVFEDPRPPLPEGGHPHTDAVRKFLGPDADSALARVKRPPAVEPTPHRAEPERPDPEPSAEEGLILSPSDPYPGAQEFQRRHHEVDGTRTLHEHQGVFYSYDGAAYRAIEASAIRSKLWDFANRARTWKKRGNDDFELVPFQPTTSKVSNLFDATRAVTLLKAEHAPPCWLEERPGDPPAGLLVAFENGLLDVRDRTLHPSTPRLFTTNALPFPYVANPPEPTRWIQFLHELYGDDEGHVDEQSIATLGEMFGYFLLPDTCQQKIFLIVGPKRSGKGTIGRVLAALLGHTNVCAPTLKGLSENFGLQPLIGKQLAIIADARLSARTDQASMAERLLSISGEDYLTIDRKHLQAWTGKLATRFLIISNELPRVQDTSGALASRFIVLSLSTSFYRREDTRLTARLLEEMPGIFTWALDGRERLQARGHFVQPESALDAIQELEDLGSPIAAFLRDCCVVGPGRRVRIEELYEAWRRWCRDKGRDHPGTEQTFGRDLRAAVPGLKVSQPRWGGDRVRVYEGIGLVDGGGA